MKVLHVIPSIAIEDGGPTFALFSLVEALGRANVSITVVTTVDRSETKSKEHELRARPYLVCFKRNIQAYKVAWRIVPWLLDRVRDFDVVHVHAVFSFTSVAAALIARWKGVPYVVRPLGVLNRWGIKNRRPMAKRLSYALLESGILRNARMLHFTSSQEAAQAFELDARLQKVPIIILPLPIEIPARLANHPFLERFPRLKAGEWVLFLSRFGKQKGLELLLEAFAALSSRDGRRPMLILAGGGDEKYVESLHAKTTQLGIEHRILWTGYLTGDEKWDALESATVFVLPSYSESFGIAAAEALASGCASVLSEGIPFARDAAAVGGAVVTKCDSESLREALEQLLGSPMERERLGRNGRQFAEEHFSPPAIAATLVNAYAEIAGNVASGHAPFDRKPAP